MDSDSSIKEKDIITYEIPFSITSSTENITVDIPDGGYLTPEHYYDVYAWKDSVTTRYPYMSANERIAVEVEGKTYYSSYGAANEIIPNFVTYSQVADSTSKIKIWLESKNGSKSEEKEYTKSPLFDWQVCSFSIAKLLPQTGQSINSVSITLNPQY